MTLWPRSLRFWQEAGMPWPTRDMNTVRREFVTKALLQGACFASLCREYGISRKTGYKWRQRALDEGVLTLAEHSRRPLRSPAQLDETCVCRLIRLKLRHPTWGPRKIRTLYAKQWSPAPSASSCQRVLGKAGLVLPRRRTRTSPAQRITRGLVAQAPNDVWTVDFKGWWRLRDGRRCEPLTVRDAFSRFVLAARTLPDSTSDSVRTEFERLFQLHGLPRAIKSDNGAPFASSSAPLGLSRLSAWWVALGIELDRSRPARPQDNGAHERLHKDLEAEVARCVQSDRTAQQAALDLWREEFNWVRPHDSLNQRTPGEVYRRSQRRFPAAFTLDYAPGLLPRQVDANGSIRWANGVYFVSTSLAGWPVGLRPSTHDTLEVWFSHLLLGHLELSSARFLRSPGGPQEPSAPAISA